MNAEIKKIDQYQNLTFVQMSHTPAALSFKAGTEAIKNGQLIIKEVSESGVVGNLKAENLSDDFLLLTDADILKGAKQNRNVNKSLLMAPHSKVLLDVSCVEQSRWRKVSDKFEPSSHAVDFSIRKKKADFQADKKKNIGRGDLQGMVWNQISSQMADNAFHSHTANYDELSEHLDKKKSEKKINLKAVAGSLGLLILDKGEIRSVDIFGNEEVYGLYFEGLVNAALRMPESGRTDAMTEKQIESAVQNLIDNLHFASRDIDDNYMGAGSFEHLLSKQIIGSELKYKDDIIHLTAFSR